MRHNPNLKQAKICHYNIQRFFRHWMFYEYKKKSPLIKINRLFYKKKRLFINNSLKHWYERKWMGWAQSFYKSVSTLYRRKKKSSHFHIKWQKKGWRSKQRDWAKRQTALADGQNKVRELKDKRGICVGNDKNAIHKLTALLLSTEWFPMMNIAHISPNLSWYSLFNWHIYPCPYVSN